MQQESKNNKPILENYEKTAVEKVYFNKVNKFRNLSKEEEIKYFKIFKNGTEDEQIKAKEIIVCSHLKMVIKCANKYKKASVSIEDLIQIGNLALIKSINNFNVDKGLKFISYAQTCVEYEMLTALRTSNSDFYVGRTDIEINQKIKKIIDNFSKENFRDPSIKELKQLTNLKEEDIVNYLNRGFSCARLDDTLNLENKKTLLDSLAMPEKIECDEDLFYTFNAINILIILMNNLTSLEKNILFLSYGLNGITRKTQKEIGTIFNKSQAQISRVQKKGQIKISENLQIRNLFEQNDQSYLIIDELNTVENNLLLRDFTENLKIISNINNKNQDYTELIKKIDYLIKNKKLSYLKELIFFNETLICSETLINVYLKNYEYKSALLLASYYPSNINIQKEILKYYLETKNYESFINLAKTFPKEESIQVVLCKIYYKQGLFDLSNTIISNYPDNESIKYLTKKTEVKNMKKTKIRIKQE